MELAKILPAAVAELHEVPTLDGLPFGVADACGMPLDAFHVPTAVVGLHDGSLATGTVNRTFREAMRGLSTYPADLAAPLHDFLFSTEEVTEFGWRRQGIGGRFYRVHLSRLPGAGAFTARALVSMIDRTAEAEAARALRSEMLLDGLTGLPNRAAYVEAVEEAIATAGEGRCFALLSIDLARFSRVNEGVGALAGDELILTVAHRLRRRLAPGDLLARTAGDEFGVLLWLDEGVDPAAAARASAGWLRSTLSRPIQLSDYEISIDCAIGCALWSEQTKSAGDVLGNAQVALKRAKGSGLVEVYQSGEVIRARRRFTLETDLRRAIECDQLALAFQPLLDLETGLIKGFEALARWTHPEHGVISPVEFIPVAEESGLVVPLGRWALRRTARTLAEWDARTGYPLPVRLSVNVSAVQLARDNIVEAVESSGIDPARLTLELTESTIIADPERARHVLEALNERRCTVAMDDFGTGHSCLAYLQRLPIDVLKIDRSFITDMHHNRDSMAIVRAVLSLARSLGLSTTAEGIELPETAAMLGALGCGTGQGYHFARPLAPDDAYAFLVAHS